MNHRVYLEIGPKKVFACSVDWPGWCRIGKTEEAARTAALARAAWAVFAEVAAASPEELRKGPRGGGRDRDKMVSHVVEAERAYARKIGVRHKPFTGEAGLTAMRADITRALSEPSGAFPPGGEGWPVRYAARRVIWHVADHIWKMEDRRI